MAVRLEERWQYKQSVTSEDKINSSESHQKKHPAAVTGNDQLHTGAVTRVGVRFRGVSVTDVMPVRAVCNLALP